MPKGGRREGAGRKAGVPNKATIARQAEIASSGLTPLDYMLGIMRDEGNDVLTRMDAAKAVAPYVHPRLAAIEHSGGLAVSHESALDELDDPA